MPSFWKQLELMAQNHYTVEPVGYTCPLIDNIQSEATEQRVAIQEVIDKLTNIVKPELLQELTHTVNWLDMIADRQDSQLEPIREANDALRNWGHENAQARYKQEDKIGELEDKVQDLMAVLDK